MVEIDLNTLANSVGYTHPRSDAFADAMKILIKDEGFVSKDTMKNCKFTDRGIQQFVAEEKPVANPQEAMERFWQHFISRLESSPKGKGEKAKEAGEIVWNKLKDGTSYTKKELVDFTTYSMERSSGFEAIMKALKDLGFTEIVDKKVQFTTKMFPFGKPTLEE